MRMGTRSWWCLGPGGSNYAWISRHPSKSGRRLLACSRSKLWTAAGATFRPVEQGLALAGLKIEPLVGDLRSAVPGPEDDLITAVAVEVEDEDSACHGLAEQHLVEDAFGKCPRG